MSYRTPYRIKVPQAPGVVRRKDVGIVLLNHTGSRCRQDSGRDAQYLADRFGTLVIAADRTGSTAAPGNTELSRRLAREPVREMFNLATQLDNIFQRCGIRQTVAAGRSAAGLGVLELARTEGLPNLSVVYAAEPAGCYDVSPQDGKQQYRQYLSLQKRWMTRDEQRPPEQQRYIHPRNDAADLPLPARFGRLTSMAWCMLADRYYNQRHWNQDLVVRYAGAVAIAQGIPTVIDFAEQSMVLPADQANYEAYLERLQVLQETSGDKLQVHVQPRTVHKSFDNRHFFAACIQQAVETQTDISLPAIA